MNIQRFIVFTFIIHVNRISKGYYLNKISGNNVCDRFGGLFSEKQFIENNGLFNLEADSKDKQWTISNGESVWINGYAEYSNMLSFVGCYYLPSTVNRISLGHDSVYTCLERCEEIYPDWDLSIVGSNTKECVCLQSFQSYKLIRVSVNDCDIMDPYNLRYNSKKNITNFTLYIATSAKRFNLGSSEFQQCVNAQLVESDVIYKTESCYNTNSSYFICASVDHSRIRNICTLIDKSGMCIGNSSETSWSIAEKQCFKSSGYLINTLSPDIKLRMKHKQRYWIGRFRSFRIVSNSSISTVCLSATRVGDQLVLDPDDCSKPKRVLCANGLYDELLKSSSVAYLNISQSTNKRSMTASFMTTDSANIQSMAASFNTTQSINKPVTNSLNITQNTNMAIANGNSSIYINKEASILMSPEYLVTIVTLIALLVFMSCFIYWKRQLICRRRSNRNMSATVTSNDHFNQASNTISTYANLYATPVTEDVHNYDGLNPTHSVKITLSKAVNPYTYAYASTAYCNVAIPEVSYSAEEK